MTIYIPTHRTNAAGDGMYKDKTTLKNQLKEAAKQLSTWEMKDEDVDDYLKPIVHLMEDDDFWRKQSDGLAIFYDGEELLTYSIPKVFKEYTYVNTHLYLKPMADLVHGSGRHFIMTLSLGDVQFFEATQNTITEVTIEDLVPQTLVEAVGGDFEDKSLQRRSGQGEKGGSEGMYHGHGDGAATEKKEEAKKFFREVDKGIMKMLHDEDAPLVVACVDYLFPIYKEVNSYKPLKDQHIAGNYEHKDILELKEKAWDIVKEEFGAEKEKAKEQVNALLNNGKASTTVDDIVPSAITGRAEALFIKENEEIWGKYIKEENKIDIEEVRRVGDTGLLNKAAVETINHGGKVYLVPEDEMPVNGTIINAVYRYEM
ncbi:MAG: hypothetical protein ABJH05_10665 [Fulvivirga sp.]